MLAEMEERKWDVHVAATHPGSRLLISPLSHSAQLVSPAVCVISPAHRRAEFSIPNLVLVLGPATYPMSRVLWCEGFRL